MASIFKNVTSGTIVSSSPASLEKVIVNSHTTGSYRLFNGTSYAATAFGGTFTPASGSSTQEYEAKFDTGLYIHTGGTVDLTVLYNGDQVR